jgi:hypothetical protein
MKPVYIRHDNGLTSPLNLVSCRTLQNTSWAQQQVETAANFNLDSLFWACVSGGAAVQVRRTFAAFRTFNSILCPSLRPCDLPACPCI